MYEPTTLAIAFITTCVLLWGMILGRIVPGPFLRRGMKLRLVSNSARRGQGAVKEAGTYWRVGIFNDRGQRETWLLTDAELVRLRARAAANPEDL